MGEVNDVLMEYLRDNVRFADLFNGILFGGESVIRAEELYEGSEVFVEKFVEKRDHGEQDISGSLLSQDGTENNCEKSADGTDRRKRDDMAVPSDKSSASARRTTLRVRDLKKWMHSGCGLRILAAENQNLVDYTMPWRGMNYDDLQYEEQIRRIKKQNRLERKLETRAEWICGLRKCDRLAPVFTICLYHGEEPWDGPRTLKDMMDFGRDGERWKAVFSDYGIRIVCLNEMTDFSCFHSPLKDLFGMIPYRKDKKALKEYVERNAAYRHLDEETAKAVSVLIGMKGFEAKKERFQEGEGYDMCTAWRELMEDATADGIEQGKWLCYLNALKNNISPEVARLITGISEEDAKKAEEFGSRKECLGKDLI